MLTKLWKTISGSRSNPGEPRAVYSPLSGSAIPLDQVEDPVFSGRMLGDGLAVLPVRGEVVAPFDGKVISVFPTGHAVGLLSNDGVECLIHVGLDTVTLNGSGFAAKVKQGQTVRRGELLLTVDLPVLQAAAKSVVSPVIVTNSAAWRPVSPQQGDVEAGRDILFYVESVGS